MFTGLVQQLAKVISLSNAENGVRLLISCKVWDTPVELGESISASGCCLTIVSFEENNGELSILFDVVPETLRCTTLGRFSEGAQINVERSLRADSLLGGHFVQGHVDGVENVLGIESKIAGERRIRFSLNSVDEDTIVSKGSVTIDGVSLTIAAVGSSWFEVVLVPTTIKDTTLGKIKIGDFVNIEADILAKTIVQVARKMQYK
jgi:riboflavin synthase